MTVEKIDRYEIKNELGRGGMATVYLAHDPRFERDVAVKALPREFLHDPQFRARFEREAKTIAALDHPAIVPVFDFGEHDGQPYLVMRYMAGGSLAERMAKSPIPLPDIAVIVKEIAPGLDAAHRKGVVHRDIKPGNILFDAYDKAYVADFGVVKLAEATMTLTMGTIGTPQYMSPEQALGQDELDGRSDIYSLGVVVYQLLCGKLPFEATTPAALIHAHVYDPPPDIRGINPDVPAAVKAVVEKALSKERGDRYSTTQEFAAALAEAIELPATQVTADAEELPAAPETTVLADEPAAKPKEKAPPPKRKTAKKSPEKKRKDRPAPKAEGSRRIPSWTWLAGGGIVAVGLLLWGLNSRTPAGIAVETLAASPTSVGPATDEPAFAATPLGGGTGSIAFASLRDGNREIYVMDVDGGDQTNLTNNQADDFDPSWSPDGRQIAFVSNRDGNQEIYTMDADGGNQTRLTNSDEEDRQPAWSPDGRRIAFSISTPGGAADLFVMDLDGGNLVNLTNCACRATTDFAPSWSPDGRQIAFMAVTDSGLIEIFVMDADGKNQTQLTNGPSDNSSPQWSPDGERIAFHSFRDGHAEIYVMNADGSGQTRLTEGDADNFNPSWSPDGRQIAFVSLRDGLLDDVFIVDVDTGDQTRLTDDEAEDFDPAWSP
jgi:Tol biopolymer transport system component/serine/threonine protein kinase